MRDEYLRDKDFLLFLDTVRIKEQYIKIYILNDNEEPIQDLSGIIRDFGSIDSDGSSSLRRTSSLSIIADTSTKQKFDEITSLLSINKKVKVSLVIINNYQFDYPKYSNLKEFEIPMGIFILQTPAYSFDVNGLSISIELKDKMCLMNGECGGILPADIRLDREETYICETEGESQVLKLDYNSPVPIDRIIRELVNHFGGEQLGKIIIDIPHSAKMIKQLSNNNYLNLYNKKINDSSYQIGLLSTDIQEDSEKNFSPNEIIGFMETELTYPTNKELTATKGSPITNVLDEIVDTLGRDSFEYFYDIDGNFIFQEIKNYLNTSQSTKILECLQNGESLEYVLDKFRAKEAFSFLDNSLISNITNNPQYDLIKNDFVITGSSNDIPILYHVAIDEQTIKKPKQYNGSFIVFPMILEDVVYTGGGGGSSNYENYSKQIRLLKEINNINDFNGTENVFYLNNGEVYVWDGFQMVELKTFFPNSSDIPYTIFLDKAFTISKENWRTQLFLDGVMLENEGIKANDYYVELKNWWPKIIDVEKFFQEDSSKKELSYEDIEKENVNITYFLDIITPDLNSQLFNFMISKIGKRTEVFSNEGVINCIFETDIPNNSFFFINIPDWEEKTIEQKILAIELKIQEDNILQQKIQNTIYNQNIPIIMAAADFKLLKTGNNINSAYEVSKELIYQSAGLGSTITIDTIPIYSLEPNTRINIQNIETGINGDYIINTINYPLEIGGIMSLTCKKALDRI